MSTDTVLIRNETQADEDSIRNITKVAFEGKWYSDNTEFLLIDKLRRAGKLSVSLVAELHGEIVGHVAFSSVTIDDKDIGWYGVGPISVFPLYQKKRNRRETSSRRIRGH